MRPRDDSGATAVEFAIVLPIAITFIGVALYAGMYFFYAATAGHVARIVARDASIPSHGVYPSTADELRVAHDAVTHDGAEALLPDPTSIRLTPQPAVGEGNELTVTVTYQLPGLSTVGRILPFLPHPSGTLQRSVTVRYE